MSEIIDLQSARATRKAWKSAPASELVPSFDEITVAAEKLADVQARAQVDELCRVFGPTRAREICRKKKAYADVRVELAEFRK